MNEHGATDQAAEQVRDEYQLLIAAIKRNIDPRSNTVLLVDDERGIRAKVARDVRKFDPNIVIYEAANGKDGLEKLAVIRNNFLRDPLFIVLDLNMPVMDGWQFIEHLREEYQTKGLQAGIPIIVLSSTSGEKGRTIFTKQSVHHGKAGYTPLVSVAKEVCVDKSRYDVAGEKGLMTWLEYFCKSK